MKFMHRMNGHIVLVLLLLLSLTACGSKGTAGTEADSSSGIETAETEADSAAEVDWGNLLSSMTQGGTLTCDPELNRAYLAIDETLITIKDNGEFISADKMTLSSDDETASMHFLRVEDGRLYFVSNNKLYSLQPTENTHSTREYSYTRAGWGLVLDGLFYYSATMNDTIQYQGLSSTLPGSGVNVVAEDVDTRTLQRCPTEDGLYYVSLEDTCLWYVGWDGVDPIQCTTVSAFSPVASGSGDVYYIGEDGSCYSLDDGATPLFSGCEMLFAADGGLVWFCDADLKLWVWAEDTGTASLVYDAPVSSFQKAGYWYSLYDMENMETVYGILTDDGMLRTMQTDAFLGEL